MGSNKRNYRNSVKRKEGYLMWDIKNGWGAGLASAAGGMKDSSEGGKRRKSSNGE